MNNRLLLLWAGVLAMLSATTAPAEPALYGTGDLGLVVERATGAIHLINTTKNDAFQRIDGLGDLSHASAVYSRDMRYAYLFGRDGGLSKIDLLARRVDKRVIQAGNSIGGAISQNGRWVAVSNYEPGGVKIFDSRDLNLLHDIPAAFHNGKRSKVVGLVDAPGNRFVCSLFDADQIWLIELDGPKTRITQFNDIGRQPYDALITPDGRYYLAGLFGEDGVALLDLWNPDKGVRKILTDYGRGEQKLPVYKMPHLEGWAVAGNRAFIPAVGRHELIVVDTQTWKQTGRVALHGQPVFAMAQPGGRQVWVNFAPPHNDTIQVIDVQTEAIRATLKPGKAALHMEFTPRGEAVWISIRDENRVDIYDTATLERLDSIHAEKPSGIFFTARAHRTGL